MSESTRIDAMGPRDVAAVAAVDASMGMTEDQLRAELERPWSRRWVARDASDVVAYATAWHVADELLVMNVATRADRRRRGIARALMLEMLRYARSHGIRHLFLEVRRSNCPAATLYRSLGFFATGVRARYYGDGEDAIEMTLEIDPETGGVVVRSDEVALDA